MRCRFLLALLSLPGLLHAQAPISRPSGPHPSLLFVAADIGSHRSATRETHWREGALVGAGLVGIAIATFGYEFCREGENTRPTSCLPAVPLGFVIGALVGVGPGAMIGARFPKHEGAAPEPAPASGGTKKP